MPLLSSRFPISLMEGGEKCCPLKTTPLLFLDTGVLPCGADRHPTLVVATRNAGEQGAGDSKPMTKLSYVALLLLVAPICARAQVSEAASAPSGPPAGVTAPAPIDSHDPLLDVPPLPPGKATLVGGNVVKVDRVRNSVTVEPFGGGRLKVFFDERTHIYRDGVETTQAGIRKDDRVYVDTMLDGARVFAKNIRVGMIGQTADARGQLLGYRAKEGKIIIRDELSAEPITFRVDSDTKIRDGAQPGTIAALRPGSLVELKFAAGDRKKEGVAKEIAVLASPGASFVFAGKVTHLDLRDGVLALQNTTDDRVYDIRFDAKNMSSANLGVGSEITVEAVFSGSSYSARNITVAPAAQQE
jgi:hypothetical protein